MALRTIPNQVLKKTFLFTSGSFWFLAVFCAMFLASEVWRFYHTIFFMNTETARRAITGVLVLAALIAYIIGLVGCCAGLRITRNGMIVYLVIAAVGILVQVTIIIILFAGSKMSLEMTNIAGSLWNAAGRDIQTLIQFELHCCGFDSPEDVGATGPDVSCYEIITSDDLTEYKPYTVGCRPKMESILRTRWGVLRVFCAVIAVVQVFGIISGSSILFRIRPAPVTVAEWRQQKKPQLKYNPVKKTPTTAPVVQRSRSSAGNRAGTDSGVGRDPSEGDNATTDDTRAITSSHSPLNPDVSLTPVEVDTSPEAKTRQSHEEGDMTPQDDMTPTRKSSGEGDVIPVEGVAEGTSASQYDDTAPLVSEEKDTTPGPDNDTGGAAPVQ